MAAFAPGMLADALTATAGGWLQVAANPQMQKGNGVSTQGEGGGSLDGEMC